MHRRSDYFYLLPTEQIAQAPADRRDRSRLLVVGPCGREHGLADRYFSDVVELLPAPAVLVINDTRVFPARLRTVKATGGQVELLFLERVQGPAASPEVEHWRCMAKSSKKLAQGMQLCVEAAPGKTLMVASGRAPDSTVIIEVRGSAHALLEQHGEVPLPPYIARPQGVSHADATRYQTVYAREPGAVAAPTAGLHFTEALLAALGERGITIAPITLHVGMGTFAPVRVENLDEHVMHTERYVIPEASAASINHALDHGQPVITVGTTCVRALESAAAGQPGRVAPGPATTDLFIRPGYSFRVVDCLITNFHLPESTLLMLVCAFAGYERTMAAYAHAVAGGYRFFSYGDAMLLCRDSAS